MAIRDNKRIERVKNALQKENLDAIICTLPSNVLMLTGYFPVVGTSVAIFTRDGQIRLIVPTDEKNLAENGWAEKVETFSPGSLEKITNAGEAVQKPLQTAIKDFGLKKKRVGYEYGSYFQPASYASMRFYGTDIADLLEAAEVSLVCADEILARLRAVKTPVEIERIKKACRIAERAFENGKKHLQVGLSEQETAAFFEIQLGILEESDKTIIRADGYAFCVSGENSVKAAAAYQRSRRTKLKENEFVLVHCNSYADGFWTDITRTFYLGEPSAEHLEMYEVVFAARKAALAAIRPHVKASDVDKAAREVLTEKGFGKYFTHGTGHEVGFAAINHDAIPRIHPVSADVLETGMTFNVEPAIYIENIGGLRHCEMVAVAKNGYEILTPFLSEIEKLIVSVQSPRFSVHPPAKRGGHANRSLDTEQKNI
ncbi:MAG: M24 family metallopeptidase [Pyrinomonadaceae bacterium]